MDWNVRLLTQDDLLLYQELRLKSFLETPFAFTESIEDENQRTQVDFEQEILVEGNPPEHFVLGVFDEEQLIGFLKFRRDQRSKARHKSMIHAMYVDPAYRMMGIGKLLIDKLLDRVHQLEGLEQIHLWVLHANDVSASKFYEECGFVRQGPLVKKDLKVGDVYVDAEYKVLYLA